MAIKIITGITRRGSTSAISPPPLLPVDFELSGVVELRAEPEGELRLINGAPELDVDALVVAMTEHGNAWSVLSAATSSSEPHWAATNCNPAVAIINLDVECMFAVNDFRSNGQLNVPRSRKSYQEGINEHTLGLKELKTELTVSRSPIHTSTNRPSITKKILTKPLKLNRDTAFGYIWPRRSHHNAWLELTDGHTGRQ
jgi:hypothetical protein